MATEQVRSKKTAKIAAITAGAVVVGIGATFTLASWNDSEWVSGLLDGAAGIGTNTFEVQQNASLDYAAEGWGDYEEMPGNELTFETAPLTMTPGDVIYAPVSLRTIADSIGGTVTLQAPQQVDTAVTDELLWSTLNVTVYTSNETERPECSVSGLEAWGDELVSTATFAASAAASTSQTLEADSGSVQHYCFVVEFPDNDANRTNEALQGTTIAPAWEFESVSE